MSPGFNKRIFRVLEGPAVEIICFGVAASFMHLGTVVRSRTLVFSSVMALMDFMGY
jgi:hypothetical protein